MKAAQFTGDHQLHLIEKDHRELQPNEVLIQVAACGICSTDQKILKGESHSTPPVVIGHEFCGTVQKAGDDVHDISPGDFVSVDPNIVCGRCQYCRRGKVNLCENLTALGVDIDGGFAEYCIVPAAQCYHISNEIAPEYAALAEPLSCALYGIKKAEIKPGDSVAIIGGGLIGYLMVQLSSLSGAKQVLISEVDKNRRDICLAAGADIGIDPQQISGTEKVRDYTKGGADIVIECVGSVSTSKESLEMIKPGGTVVLFGVSPRGRTISLSPYEIFKNDITIRGSFLNPFTFQDVVRLIERGKVDFGTLTLRQFSLDEINEAFEYQKSRREMKINIRLQAQ